MERMPPKILVAFALGCFAGGGAVWMVSDRGVQTAAGVTGSQKPGPAPTPLYAAQGKVAEATPKAAVTQAGFPVTTTSTAATSVAALSTDAVPTASYDFGSVTRSAQRLDDIFCHERTDQEWASQTIDSLNLVLSRMPERSVIGDYGLTCKESLCKLEIRGDPKLFAGNDPKYNVQPALLKMMSEPPASELFDDDMMNVTVENDGLATITLFAHRRKLRH